MYFYNTTEQLHLNIYHNLNCPLLRGVEAINNNNPKNKKIFCGLLLITRCIIFELNGFLAYLNCGGAGSARLRFNAIDLNKPRL